MDDDLLQDLEILGDGDDITNDDIDEVDVDTINAPDKVEDPFFKAGEIRDIDDVAKLRTSKLYISVIEVLTRFKNIDGYINHSEQTDLLSDEEEHKLIVKTNNLASEIDNEILIVHKFIKALYSKRFPELESLVVNPLDYARTVKAIGNDMDIAGAKLKEFLPPAAVMVVTVASTTTEGKHLIEIEMKKIGKACDLMTELEITKRKIFNFLELKMNNIAPNLSALLSSGIAAKLIGTAGGLSSLANIPSCDILVLGRSKSNTVGISLTGYHNHWGLIYFSDLVTAVPDAYKRKAARALAAKVCLAARIDLSRSSPNGAMGRAYHEYVQKHIDLILQPPVIKAVKPLPVPEDGPRRRRAGRRFRNIKQRMQLNDLNKAQNRVAFGVPEKEVGFELGESKGLGMLGAQFGKIRSYQADTRFKMPLSKRHRTLSNAISNSSGFSSSVAFTPIKGIELENPELQMRHKTQAEESKLFSSTVFSGVVSQKASETNTK